MRRYASRRGFPAGPLVLISGWLGWGLLFAGAARADLCSLEAVPAATLLLPYFEVDLDDPNGVTTLFSINNAAAEPALAHLVFWTDWSYPTLSFDVYLTGYDVVSVNLRDVFSGEIPITADAPNDPGPGDQPCGDKSPCGGLFAENPHWDDSDPEVSGLQGFPNCEQIFPGFVNPVIAGTALERLVLGHTGRLLPSLDACVGLDHGDNIVRGYITIDSVSECSLALGPSPLGVEPDDKPYFAQGGTGIANNKNQLWGDWSMVHPADHFAQSDHLVHIEAHDELTADQIPLVHPATGATATVTPQETGYTFYGRFFQDPADGRDNREPLGTVWASRYLNGGAFDHSDILVWRDPTSDEFQPVPGEEEGSWCQSGPSWYPLNETEILAFNEAEDAAEVCLFEGGVLSPPRDHDPRCFHLATGRYTLGQGLFDFPYSFGWLYLNLNLPKDAPINDADFGSSGLIAQSHVTTMHNALGVYSVGLQAIELRHACEDFNEIVNGGLQNGGVNTIPLY